MIQLLHQIQKLARTGNGWCSEEKATVLANTVIAMRHALSVEIGVWSGASLLPLALAHKFIGRGQVIGIDPWSAEVSAVDQPPEHKKWWSEVDHEAIYLDFCKKVQAYELGSFVRIWKKASDDVEPPKGIGLLHIDGNHCAQALRDAQRFAVNVNVGGILCLDDISGDKTPTEWKKGVNNAAEFCKSVGFVELYRLDTSAFYQRAR